jgi:RNA polymerase sigma factor (sigma-70 family)
MYKYVQRNQPFEHTEEQPTVELEYDNLIDLLAYVMPKVIDTRTRFIVELYVIHGMSMMDIAKGFGMSRERVRQLIKKGLECLSERPLL